jgi:hypothetical protein
VGKTCGPSYNAFVGNWFRLLQFGFRTASSDRDRVATGQLKPIVSRHASGANGERRDSAPAHTQ